MEKVLHGSEVRGDSLYIIFFSRGIAGEGGALTGVVATSFSW